MSEERKPQTSMNKSCMKCAHYKKKCDGIVTADFVELLSCGDKMKFKAIKKKKSTKKVAK